MLEFWKLFVENCVECLLVLVLIYFFGCRVFVVVVWLQFCNLLIIFFVGFSVLFFGMESCFQVWRIYCVVLVVGSIGLLLFQLFLLKQVRSWVVFFWGLCGGGVFGWESSRMWWGGEVRVYWLQCLFFQLFFRYRF